MKLSKETAYSGSISVRKCGRPTYRKIKSKMNWFDECEYYTLKLDENCLVIFKHRLEIPKNAYRRTKVGLQAEIDLPCGDFILDEEETTEDKLVVLLSLNP